MQINKEEKQCPLAAVLANPRLAAAVSAGLEKVEAKLADGRTVRGSIAKR